MAITIPDRTKITRASGNSDPDNGQVIPGLIAKVAMTNPGPVAVSTSQAGRAQQTEVEPAAGVAGRAGYIGYNTMPNRGAGQALGVVRGMEIDGFAGVEPGKRVYVNSTSADEDDDHSGLTHTPPAQAGDLRQSFNIGTASATGAIAIIAPDDASTLAKLSIAVKTAITADDTDYWTFRLINKSKEDADMILATDANTTKATGGSGLGAYTARNLTLHGTAANLECDPGDVLELQYTKSGSAANLVQFTAQIELALTGSLDGARIGVGTSTTAIRFD